MEDRALSPKDIDNPDGPDMAYVHPAAGTKRRKFSKGLGRPAFCGVGMEPLTSRNT